MLQGGTFSQIPLLEKLREMHMEMFPQFRGDVSPKGGRLGTPLSKGDARAPLFPDFCQTSL